MHKIMLVIENEIERKFLEKLIKRLGFPVVALSRTNKLAEELKDFFPDIVFASMLGKSTKTLEALARIKVQKGIPRVIFVRSAKDTVPLNPQQKRLLDGVLYSPIDPFKLLDILSKICEMPIEGLKGKYREMLGQDRGQEPVKVVTGGQQFGGKVLIIDSDRNQKYDEIVMGLKEKNKDHAEFNPQRFRELQKKQDQESQDDPEQRALKKDFITKLFTAKPKASGDN